MTDNSKSRIEHMKKQIVPPSVVYGMKNLDYELFRKEVILPFILTNTDQINTISKSLKPYFLKIPEFKPVQPYSGHPDLLKIFLNPDKLNDQVIQSLKQLETLLFPISSDMNEKSNFIGFQKHELTYKNFSHHHIFRAIIPGNEDSVTGFSTVGHILHLNLRQEILPYKNLIGQVSSKQFSHSYSNYIYFQGINR